MILTGSPVMGALNAHGTNSIFLTKVKVVSDAR